MAERSPDPRSLDVAALCRKGQLLQGQQRIANMARLGASLGPPAAEDEVASWTAQGSLVPVAGGEPEIWLHLMAHAEVSLQCQRCLQPTLEGLTVDRRFRFVRNEDEAARLDEESEDDVLALPERLDLEDLLEDELILGLPLVPRHDQCQHPLPMRAADAGADEEAPNPFAALAALRSKPQGRA